MAPITKLLKKTKMFKWTTKCQIAWEDIKNRYIQCRNPTLAKCGVKPNTWKK
jgi:hypothetical protein